MIGPTLVVGASGAVGSALLCALAPRGLSIIAWTRYGPEPAGDKKGVRDTYPQTIDSDPPLADTSSVSWQSGELFNDPLPQAAAILSAGPLDGLVAALSRSPACVPRAVVALSSSSAAFKRDSADDTERKLSAKLAASEVALIETCRDRGARCVILRPTLIYGGVDVRNLGAIEALARRLRFIVLPRSAHGLRMPIHAGDLATAMLGALDGAAAGEILDIGGGETLAYDAMIRRVLEARGLPPRLFLVPDPLFRALLRMGHRAGLLLGLSEAMVARMREDLVVDDAAARRLLGHAPGIFRP